MAVVGTLVVILAIFALIVLFSAIKILREYERGVIFRLRPADQPEGSGADPADPLHRPDGQRSTCARLRSNIPPQEVITRDNAPTPSTRSVISG